MHIVFHGRVVKWLMNTGKFAFAQSLQLCDNAQHYKSVLRVGGVSEREGLWQNSMLKKRIG